MEQLAIVVLGMHRSGTSCLAAMLSAAGGRVPGEAVRNWDNPGGHYESIDLIRLNDDVLACSGGHWLEPPEVVRWTPEHAAARDALLASPGVNVWKDPRSLLVLPFWQATPVQHAAIGVVRHPLAVARSLHAWRGHAIDEGLELWLAHVRPLEASGVPVLVFDQPREAFLTEVTAFAAHLGLPADPDRIAAAYARELVHHDASDGPSGDPDLLATCVQLYERFGGSQPAGITFPWAAIGASLQALAAGEVPTAHEHARSALTSGADPAAVAAPLAAAWLHAHQGPDLLTLLDAVPLPPALDGLLRGKALLDARRPAEAARQLVAACAVPEPLYEARHLLPVALWESGDHAAADQALAALLPVALYPFRVHARRAEWAWRRGEHDAAFAHLDAALASAPHRRHGRLLHRRAAWRQELGDRAGADADRTLARERDPTFR